MLQITYLEEYYLTNYEIEVLTRHAEEMAAAIPSGSMVIELGSGSVETPPFTPSPTAMKRERRLKTPP